MNLISVNDIDLNDWPTWLDNCYTHRKIRGNYKVCLMFLEPSTRTLLSFERVANSMDIETYRFPFSSSLEKGESFSDTLFTLEALGFDAVVVRCSFSLKGYLEQYPTPNRIKIINAGDADEHPTQALGDHLIISDWPKSKVAFVGDIYHSRVYRSLKPLLEKFGHRVKDSVVDFDNIDDIVEWADFTYMLRPQKERWPVAEHPGEVWPIGQFEKKHLEKTYLMHPGPVTDEVDVEAVYASKSLIRKQIVHAADARRGVFHHVFDV